ncbi:M20/M25/M40 family metallo-hydrolase [Puia sp. P3]|uniref:M20/M25/M40 family metallo-hydrolase n=1 Tax=Puia sp. P3 TaxID=3423952 RepID=UPI003D66891F
MRKPYDWISLKNAAFLALILSPVLVRAQVDAAMTAKIREEGLNHSQIPHIAHELTDVSGPRLTNSPGYHQAAAWIVKTLKEWGLTQAQAEPWGEFGYGWSAEKTYLAMRTPYYSPMIAYAAPWSGSTNGPVSAAAYLVEKLDSGWIAAHAAEMKGRILVVRSGDSVLESDDKADATRYSDSALANIQDTYMMTSAQLKGFLPIILQRFRLKSMLASSGAAALLQMSGHRDGTVLVQSLIGYRKQDQPAVPELVVAKEDYLRVVRLLEEGRTVQLELQSDTRLKTDDLRGHNVVGEILGTDPTLKSELVMLGGHLDSWSAGTGATDNGAGCIVALEAVRILKSLGVQPKRTIRIALWDGEEQGLLGSFHYVRNHFGDPADMKFKPEQEKVSAYYNLDNGSGKIRGIFVQGNEKVVPIFKEWFQPFADLGASTITMHNTGSTDHLSFDAVGIPGFQFIQDPLDYETRTHHTNEDNYDHLHMDDLKQAATILASFVYNTAMRAEKMPRKPLPKPEKFIFDDFLP